ncbi:hypothetical protein U9M48_042031 [Paspalum notatum var. saurae]|uniref:Integrase catalytic domain-containing protein n=1 Tax=Paspalum notatum var. saurae TaxID=547442 RepID=A0AAQ3XFT8_PASNO
MTGSRAAFASIDTTTTGTVRFGDNSVIRIAGCGSILYECKNGEHRALNNVYYLPRLTANIISVGQLDEEEYDVHVRHGVMRIRDDQQHLMAKVRHSPGCLYYLELKIVRPVCLAASADGKGGTGARDAVLEHVDQLCDACLAGKHRHAPFPQQAQRRATRSLDLIHGDLCGPVTPATPSDNRFFLLLVDDYSRYMWLTLLRSKDEAANAIKHIQAPAERKSGNQLGALRTDRGGEFTAAHFRDYCTELGVHRELTAPYSPQQNGVVE